MAATMLVQEKNGAGETATNKTAGTVRHKNADNATVDTANPLIKPASGQEYSYQKWLRLNVSGTFTQVSNLKVYTDGANGLGTGVKLWWITAAAYSTPVIPNESLDPPQHASTNMTNAFSYTSAAPLSLGAGPFDNTALPKDIGSYLISVMEVETTAAQGITPGETITFAWDEI